MTKLVSLLVLSMALATSAFAGAHNEMLKQQMKDMAADLKSITSGASNPALYPALAVKADHFTTLVAGAVDMIPTTVTDPDRKAVYQKAMHDLADLGASLSAALKAGDTGAVAKAIDALKAAKSDGHDQFRSDDDKAKD